MFGIDNIIGGMLGLGKTYIESKEQQLAYTTDVMKLGFQLQEHILTMQTTPKMDAAVKFMYAFKEMVLPLFRPIGSGLLSAFAAYAAYKHIDLGSLGVVLGSAFPGWMGSRGLEKLTSKDN